MRREDGDGEESQEHEAADGRVLDVGVGCGGEEHHHRRFFTKRAGGGSIKQDKTQTGGQTWEAFAGQVSQRPEDVTHERRAAGAGLSDGGEDLLDVDLQVLLQKQATRVFTQNQTRGMTGNAGLMSAGFQ